MVYRIAIPSRGLTFHQEIQDAVAARERLVFVVGPKAAVSDYVRQEWQFALQVDKGVTPILRQGDYPLVPDDLKLLHCEDFRDDAGGCSCRSRFEFHPVTIWSRIAEEFTKESVKLGVRAN